MNNIYVDEVPDSCFYCDFFIRENYCCWLMQKDAREYRDDCPLIPITVRLKEERKQVVQEIREWCKENFDYKKLPNELGCWVAVNREELNEILDKIERGE